MIHICQATRQAIQEQLGTGFEVVSLQSFVAHGQRRCRYTVRKPSGSKQYHLIGFESGQIRLVTQ